MSSTYYVLCLSHDPAADCGEYRTPEDAEAAIAAGVGGHPGCDLLIGRYSAALVEAGCPPTRDRPGQPLCRHGDTVWTDIDVLRLLAAGYQSGDAGVREAMGALGFRCWSWERLRRLRDELGITLDEEQSKPTEQTAEPDSAPEQPAKWNSCAHCGKPIQEYPHVREWTGDGSPGRFWHSECDDAARQGRAPDGEDGGPVCRYCGADCSNGRSWDGGDLYACTRCANARAAIRRFGGDFDRLAAASPDLSVLIAEAESLPGPADEPGTCTATCDPGLPDRRVYRCVEAAGHYPGRWHRSGESADGTRFGWHDGTDGATPHGASDEEQP